MITTKKIIAIQAFSLVAMMLLGPVAAHASEVTGTVSSSGATSTGSSTGGSITGGSGSGSTATGSITGGSGSTIAGTIGGGGGSTIGGTVSSSGGGGSTGGSTSTGGGQTQNNPGGPVIGGSVIPFTPGLPNTGAPAENANLLIASLLSLTAFIAYATLAHRQNKKRAIPLA